ncbi:uncharacterized protein LOC143845522 [Tasmannia lanceolata]|uniref:uncharacterized protein LOC143845522 n=1 Tax=Tasmannia lanceolata TaxID=3420 RepID=UPI0040636472
MLQRLPSINLILEKALVISSAEDEAIWKDTIDESFSLKSAWNGIREHHSKIAWASSVWFKGHIPKMSFTAWLGLHQILSTKDMLIFLGQNREIRCPLCSAASESIDHLFFQCSYSAWISRSVLWRFNIRRKQKRKLMEEEEWMRTTFPGSNQLPTAICIAFTSSIYLIWQERNNKLHGADNSHKRVILSNILHTIRSRCIFLRLDSQTSSRDLAFSKAFDLPMFRSQKPTKRCKWVHPKPGCVKLNCDVSLASSSASIGGLLRTNDSSVLAMYSQDKIQMTIQGLELEAICHGDSLASALNIDRLWIESDSLLAANVIEGSVPCPWKKRLPLAHLKNTLLKFVSWKVSHI